MAIDMNDPEVKAALKAAGEKAAETAAADFDARIEALDAKNKEILAKLNETKAELRKVKDINPEDHAKLEAENEGLRTDLAAALKAAKDATASADKAAKALETETGFTRKLLVENGLREALAANGVTHAVHQKAAMAMLAGGVQVAAEGDSRIAKLGDKALADAVKEWAASDEGKHFVAGAGSGGGGAPGGGQGGGGGKTVSRSVFDGMSQPERATFAKEGGKVVDAAA